jgi:hypothetical protein
MLGGVVTSGKGEGLSTGESALASTAVAALGLVAAGQIGGPAGVPIGELFVAGVTPVALQVLERSRQRANTWRTVAAARALSEALDQVSGDAERFMARTDDPRRALLVDLALGAAGRTAYDDKVVALGRLLGRAVEEPDDAKLDEQAALMAAVADIEAPHVAVLGRMRPARMITPDARKPNVQRSSHAYSRRELAGLFPQYGAALDSVLAVLERHGLVRRLPVDVNLVIAERQRNEARPMPRPSSQPPIQWDLTAFGMLACDVFKEAARVSSRHSDATEADQHAQDLSES